MYIGMPADILINVIAKGRDLGVADLNIVISANHLMRAAYPAMRHAAATFLRHGRTFELEDELIGLEEVLELILGTRG
jgi:phosphoenolpyruvate phosphomutase / 2-hydroxyethylphosphonate cytidylyltransferase